MRFLHQMPTLMWHATYLSSAQRYALSCALVTIIITSWFYFIHQPLMQQHTQLLNECAAYTHQQEYQHKLMHKKTAMQGQLAQLSTRTSNTPIEYQIILRELITLANKAHLSQLQLIPHNEQSSHKAILLQATGEYVDISDFFSLLAKSTIPLLPSEITIEQQLEGKLQLLAQISCY